MKTVTIVSIILEDRSAFAYVNSHEQDRYYAFEQDPLKAEQIKDKLNKLGDYGLKKLKVIKTTEKFIKAVTSIPYALDNSRAILKKLSEPVDKTKGFMYKGELHEIRSCGRKYAKDYNGQGEGGEWRVKFGVFNLRTGEKIGAAVPHGEGRYKVINKEGKVIGSVKPPEPAKVEPTVGPNPFYHLKHN